MNTFSISKKYVYNFHSISVLHDINNLIKRELLSIFRYQLLLTKLSQQTFPGIYFLYNPKVGKRVKHLLLLILIIAQQAFMEERKCNCSKNKPRVYFLLIPFMN